MRGAAGLFHYQMGEVVRVVDYYERTPVVAFEGGFRQVGLRMAMVQGLRIQTCLMAWVACGTWHTRLCAFGVASEGSRQSLLRGAVFWVTAGLGFKAQG